MNDEAEFWFARVDIDVARDNTLSVTARFIFMILCTFDNNLFPLPLESGVYLRSVRETIHFHLSSLPWEFYFGG